MRHRGNGGTGFPVSGCSGGIRNAPAGTGAGCSVGWEGGAGDGGSGAGFSGVSGFVGPGMQVVSFGSGWTSTMGSSENTYGRDFTPLVFNMLRASCLCSFPRLSAVPGLLCSAAGKQSFRSLAGWSEPEHPVCPTGEYDAGSDAPFVCPGALMLAVP